MAYYCSAISYQIPGNTTVFVRVVDSWNQTISGYTLTVEFP